MSRRSLLISFMLLCFLLCARAENNKDYVRVTLVDSVFFTAEEPSISVEYGADAVFVLSMRESYSVSACSYADYEITVTDGGCLLTLHNVTRPSRVTVTSVRDAQEQNTNREFSCSIRYVLNDGTDAVKTQQYTLSYHIRPNTLDGSGITRDGYTLLCWNTRGDGSGDDIGLGSRVTVKEGECLTLYGKWAIWNNAGDFATRRNGASVVITGYRGKGNEEMLVIPGKIGGLPVETIASSFTTSMRCGSLSCRTLVLPVTLVNVEGNAFLHSKFSEIYFFDNLVSFGTDAFPNAIKTIHINAATPPRLQKDNYNARFADNMDLLIVNADRQKLIFFAGCSMCYGLDSGMVEDAFEGEYVVIDAGLNGELNALFQMECMLPYINSGDILVHAPEQMNSWQFLVNKYVDCRVYAMAEANYDLLALADFSYSSVMFDAYNSYVELRSRSDECAYSDYSALFNNYGDCLEPRPYDESAEAARDTSYSEGWGFDGSLLTEEDISFLAGIYGRFREKGCSVFFSWAPVNEQSDGNADIYAAAVSFQDKLKQLLADHDVPVISEVTDYILPGRYFYDTDYHLNDLGVILRTERLIGDIKNAQKKHAGTEN